MSNDLKTKAGSLYTKYKLEVNRLQEVISDKRSERNNASINQLQTINEEIEETKAELRVCKRIVTDLLITFDL